MNLVCKKYIDLLRFQGFLFINSTFSLFIKQCHLKFICGNTSTKVGAKFLPGLVIYSIFSSDIPLDSHDLIQEKLFNVFFSWYNY